MGRKVKEVSLARDAVRFAILGCGNIGRCLLKGLLKAKMATAGGIVVTAKSRDRREALEREFGNQGVVVLEANAEAARGANVIILAIKPQHLDEVAGALRGHVRRDQLVLSILAGKTTARIAELIGGPKAKGSLPVIRAMPNIPVMVDAGCSPFARGAHASEEHVAIVQRILSSVGETTEVKEELMDAVTGLSGSGPAYVYMMIEALADGGVQMGLPRHVAIKLAAQTIYGAGLVVKETGIHPAILREQVTTPGGTTITATTDLERHGLRPMLISAVITATQRSRELGQS